MKQFNCGIFLVVMLLCSCNKELTDESAAGKTTIVSAPIPTGLVIPDTTVAISELHFNRKNSLWTLHGELYDGYAMEYYPDSIPSEKLAYINGRKQNESISWYPDGQQKLVAHYHKGKLHGEKKKWSSAPNRFLVSDLNYIHGKLHGEQTLWYTSGQLYKKLHMNMGKEEGIQQAYRKNGALYANYEAKEGRIFGIKKSALCVSLDDEKIQYDK